LTIETGPPPTPGYELQKEEMRSHQPTATKEEDKVEVTLSGVWAGREYLETRLVVFRNCCVEIQASTCNETTVNNYMASFLMNHMWPVK
jgi:hypothetical protein